MHYRQCVMFLEEKGRTNISEYLSNFYFFETISLFRVINNARYLFVTKKNYTTSLTLF